MNMVGFGFKKGETFLKENIEFLIERPQVEKKTQPHGVDLGLEPALDATNNPIIDPPEIREGWFRKGRENEVGAYNF